MSESVIESIETVEREFTEAIGRNHGEEKQHSHLYERMPEGGYKPMCRHGWNRGDGEGFGILRGHSGKRGLCRVCLKRRDANLLAVDSVPGSHKTKWL